MSQPKANGRKLLLCGGVVVEETGERRADVRIENGLVSAVAPRLHPEAGESVLDVAGCVVGPGLVDIHTHLREPGGERAETVESGAIAGALGGYTALVAMPNTDPVIDSASIVRDVLALGEKAPIDIAVAGSITLGRRGERLSPMGEMAALGVRLFTDDGAGVQDAGLMRRALEYAADLGVVLAEHCEDASLAAGGSMHEGAWSSRLGIPGQPALAEEAMLARDLALVRLTGAPMHFLHLSTAGSIDLLRAAKADGLPVTAEVTPHHLTLTDELVSSFDPVFKVNPPLRTSSDLEVLRQAVLSGLIDAIATDHAPHAVEDKEAPFEEAPAGMLGLETALSVCYGELVAKPGASALSFSQLFQLFSSGPARIAGLDRLGHGGPIAPGSAANLVVFDPQTSWTVDVDRLASLSRNSPFFGRELLGRVRHTICHGELVVVDGASCR